MGSIGGESSSSSLRADIALRSSIFFFVERREKYKSRKQRKSKKISKTSCSTFHFHQFISDTEKRKSVNIAVYFIKYSNIFSCACTSHWEKKFTNPDDVCEIYVNQTMIFLPPFTRRLSTFPHKLTVELPSRQTTIWYRTAPAASAALHPRGFHPLLQIESLRDSK